MSWFTSLFSKTAAEPINAIGNVLDDLFTSDEEELNIEVIKQRLAQKPMMAQTEINKVQAQHRSRFVAGARPFLMWVCGLGLLTAFVVNPYIEFFSEGEKLISVPLDAMMELTLAMLGLATLRTVEKLNGASK
jgi:hypothetical protein